MLKDIIEKALNDMSIFRLFEEDGKLFVSLFDDEKLKTEISFSMLNSSYRDGECDYSTLLNSILLSILVNKYNIKPEMNYEPEKAFLPRSRYGLIPFERKLNELRSNTNPNIIIVDGDEQSGKTTLVQQYCESLLEDGCDIHWLDFNGGANDFRNTIANIINLSYSNHSSFKRRMICIVLDELRCCGYNEGKCIFEFFCDFVRILDEKNIYVRLILIQDKNNRIYQGNEGIISLTKSESLYELKGIQENHANLYRLNNEDEKFINQFVDAKNWDEKKKRVFFKILVISLFEIEVQLDSYEGEIAKELINDVAGLKVLSYPTRAKLLNRENCIQIYKSIEDSFWEMWGFESVFFRCDSCRSAAKMIFNAYYKKNKLSITDISKILQLNAYCYNQKHLKYSDHMDFMELLKYASVFEEQIIDKVESGDGSYFGNHLGAILFAAEALSFFPSDWNALAAWDRLSAWVRDMYFVEGQKLPEIRYGKESFEKTWDDFCNGKHSNSIENQITLQDIVITRYGIHLDFADLQDLKERDLQYFLSYKQRSNHDRIDMDRFYQTYILGVLFEFELTAPESRYDQNRVNLLFKMIDKNINKEDDIAYFYPARIPWVSARLLLAITMYNPIKQGNHLKQSIISKLSKSLINYLIQYSYSYKGRNGEIYRIWLPGTGRWNGILETTMMCTFALKKANANQKVILEGERYIRSQQDRWFNASSLADGLWAIETLKLKNTIGPDKVLPLAHDIWKDISPFLKNDDIENIDRNGELYLQQNLKDDKSLGDSHIARTFISLVNQLVIRKPPIFVDFDEIMILQSKCKVFISFHTESSKELAQKLSDELRAEGSFIPFCYLSEMRAGHWRVQLCNAIHMSNAFILILNKETLSASGVIDEIKWRIDDDKPIIPLICVSENELNSIRNTIDDIEYMNNFQKESLRSSLSKHHNNLVFYNDDDYFEKLVQYIKP